MNTTYALVHPITAEVKYIGCTSLSLYERYHGHLSSYRKGKTKVAVWIKALRHEGLRPNIIELESGLDHFKGRESEYFWAEYLRSLGANLLNVKTPGDRGVNVIGPPSAWQFYYGPWIAFVKYQEFIANSQPF